MLNIMTGVLQSSAYCLFVRYLVKSVTLYPVSALTEYCLFNLIPGRNSPSYSVPL